MTSTRKKVSRLPRIGMWKTSAPRSSSTVTSGIRNVRRERQDGAQEVAPGHGGGDEALEQLADPQVHQEEADAPEAAPHGIEPDQPGDQAIDIA